MTDKVENDEAKTFPRTTSMKVRARVLSGMDFNHHVTPFFFGAEHVPKAQYQNPTNRRKSTRYSWWSFLPVATALQFMKVVNIFYLCTATLQTIPSIQTTKPMAIIIPLIFVISLGILKEAIAEFKRWKEDREVNAVPVHRVVDAEPGNTAYANAKQGDEL